MTSYQFDIINIFFQFFHVLYLQNLILELLWGKLRTRRLQPPNQKMKLRPRLLRPRLRFLPLLRCQSQDLQHQPQYPRPWQLQLQQLQPRQPPLRRHHLTKTLSKALTQKQKWSLCRRLQRMARTPRAEAMEGRVELTLTYRWRTQTFRRTLLPIPT